MTIIDQHDGVDFEIHDESGKAIVRARSPIHPLLVQDGRLRSGFLQEASERLEAFLQAHGQSSEGWFFNRATEYSGDDATTPAASTSTRKSVRHSVMLGWYS